MALLPDCRSPVTGNPLNLEYPNYAWLKLKKNSHHLSLLSPVTPPRVAGGIFKKNVDLRAEWLVRERGMEEVNANRNIEGRG